MATIVLSNLAHISDYESELFSELMGSLRGYGHRVFLWSTVPKKRFEPYFLPMRWRIAELEQFYPMDRLDGSSVLREIDQEKWNARISVLAKQGVRPFRAGRELEILSAVTEYLLDELQPDLFLAWNPLCPHFGVAHDACQARGIPSLLFERAFYPDTWFAEEGGLVGHSRLAGASLEQMLSGRESAPFRESGRDYLEGKPFGELERYAQHRGSVTRERLFLGDLSEGRPRVVFFPPDDLSLGFFPTDHDDRRRHLPGFDNSFDAARALAAANASGTTIFKPHPSFLEWQFKQDDSPLVSLNHGYDELIAWADVVATTGSGLAFMALAEGKPVIQMGHSALTGKDIVTESLYSKDIAEALGVALSQEEKGNQRENFETLVGYTLTESVVSHPRASRSYRRPVDVAKDWHERFLADKVRAYGDLRELEVTARLLGVEPEEGEDAQDGGETESSEPEAVFPTSSTPMSIERDLHAIEELLEREREAEVVVDFDYTLFESNSTELYLDTVAPQWVGFLLGKIVHSLRLGRLFAPAERAAEMQDQLRVFLVTLFLPWTFFLWRRRAPRLARDLINRRLVAALRAGGCKRITVVSNGFGLLIRPLLRGLEIDVERFLASSMVPGLRNVAVKGKCFALRQAWPNIDFQRMVFVTDSAADADVLREARYPYLIRWPFEEFKAYRLTYFPFRYTAEGKYRGESVVRRHRFGEDLAVILLSYQAFLGGLGGVPLDPASIFWNLWTLFALFLSFHCIYEIGYHENDFKGALREDRPRVNSAALKFAEYPIAREAWRWAAVFGVLAFVPGLLSVAAREAPGAWLVSTIRFSESGSAIAPGLLFVSSLGLWAGILVGTRAVFCLHNHLPVSWRTTTFAVLQSLKLGAFAVFFQLTALGLALIGAQVFRHLTNYVVYRQAGNRRAFPNQLHRLQVFFLLAGLLFLLRPSLLGLGHPQFWLITAWCIFMAAAERYRPRVTGRAVVVRGLAHDLRRLVGRLP